MSFQFFAALAFAGSSLVAFGSVGSVRSGDILPPVAASLQASESQGGARDGGRCRVDVLRTGESGQFDVTRIQLDSGECICTVVTGAAETNGTAEQSVAAILENRSCRNAPLARNVRANGGSGYSYGAAESSGMSGTLIGTLLGAVAVGGGVALIQKSDSNG
jgi:hypothetical protein